MTLLETLPIPKANKKVFGDREIAYRRLLNYCYFINHSYNYAKHLDFIVKKLEAVERGEIKKLMIFVPPRFGKSELVSINFPSWYLGRNPDKRIIHSSYSASLSNTFSRRVRNIVEELKHYFIFRLKTAEDSRAVDKWDIRGHKGGLIASGVGGSITGYGADLFIIDDPVKNREEAESEVYREKTWEWYRNVVRTRLEPNASIILTMARWHRQDLAGMILTEEHDWEVINMPAIAEDNDLLGRAIGEPLWEQRYNLEAMSKTKNDVGSRVWHSLYQGNPVDPESALIKRDWIRWYDELPPQTERYGGSDTATSQKTVADNTALVDVCRDKEGWLYVDDVLCEKVSVTQFAYHIINQHKIKNYLLIKLESNNAGEAIGQRINEVGRETGTYPTIDLDVTDTDKVVRVIAFQSLIENGTIRFKRGNKKVAELVEHLLNFDGKGSDIDDDVDALGFAIKAVKQGQSLGVYTF